jgi:hypothetical protein
LKTLKYLVPFLAAALLAGCGGSDAPPPTTPADATATAPVAAPSARNADALAREAVGAKLGALLYLDKVRNHPLGPRLLDLVSVGMVFDGTDLDPKKQVERMYVAAAGTGNGEAVMVVVEHTADEAQIKKAMEALVKRSGEHGKWLEGASVPAAKIRIKDSDSVILAVSKNVLVVTSPKYAKQAESLKGTGGLPDPKGDAALIGTAEDPSESLKGRGRAPKIPPTISSARAEITLKDDGSAVIEVDGISTTPEQAKADAKKLTKEIDNATSMKVSVVRVRLFEPPKFEADNDHVKSRRELSRAELERLLSLAGAAAARAKPKPEPEPEPEPKPEKTE